VQPASKARGYRLAGMSVSLTATLLASGWEFRMVR
jgi:hypothetical protein